MPKGDRWTKREDAIIMKLVPKDAAELLERTYASVCMRRCHIRRPRPKPTRLSRWTDEEAETLKREYPTARTIGDLLPLFNGFTVEQIKQKARYMKVRRRFVGTENVYVKGHGELNDQIRMRCKEDGIPIYKLDKILKTGSYFKYNAHRRKANLRAVAKAVAFFGGTLVIDWQDR